MINRRSTAFFVPPPVYMGFHLFLLAKKVQNMCLECAGRPEGLLALKATEMSAPCFAQRRPDPPSALRRADPTRPLRVRILDSTGHVFATCGLHALVVLRGGRNLEEHQIKHVDDHILSRTSLG